MMHTIMTFCTDSDCSKLLLLLVLNVTFSSEQNALFIIELLVMRGTSQIKATDSDGDDADSVWSIEFRRFVLTFT